jgi:predicted RNA-binding protein (virulence factor B family)
VLSLSKKSFKRAVGGLYRERRIRLGETFIESIAPEEQDSTPRG